MISFAFPAAVLHRRFLGSVLSVAGSLKMTSFPEGAFCRRADGLSTPCALGATATSSG